MNQYIIGVIGLTGISLIAILGISLLTGFTGLFSFGHCGFMAIGGYVSALLVKYYHIPVFVGIILGILAATLVGVAIGYPSLKLKGDYFLIATLGFGEIVKLVIENAQSLTGGAKGLPDVTKAFNLPTIILIDIVVIVLLVNFLKSIHGRNCIAIREEETAAQAMGINITKYKVISLAISCALAGLSGAMMGHYLQYLHPVMFAMDKSNQLVLTVIMGGLGSLTGTILATSILVPLPELLRIENVQSWRMILYGLIVVLIIIFRPSGLLGNKEFSFKSLKRLVRWIKRLPKGRGKSVEE